MARVSERVSDKRVLRLIRAFLRAGVMEDGLVRPTEEGYAARRPPPPAEPPPAPGRLRGRRARSVARLNAGCISARISSVPYHPQHPSFVSGTPQPVPNP